MPSIQGLQKRGSEACIWVVWSTACCSYMRLLVVSLRRQYNAKASVNHLGNCKSSQHCLPRCKPLTSSNAGAVSEAFL